jgi:hypothetical protein
MFIPHIPCVNAATLPTTEEAMYNLNGSNR